MLRAVIYFTVEIFTLISVVDAMKKIGLGYIGTNKQKLQQKKSCVGRPYSNISVLGLVLKLKSKLLNNQFYQIAIK